MTMPLNAGHILVLTTGALSLVWFAQLFRYKQTLVTETSRASWALGFLLPLPFFAIPLSLARLGLLSNFTKFPPPFFIFMMFMLALCYAVTRAPVVEAIARKIGIRGLILLQSFRLLPEWAIATGHEQGIAPVQLSYQGYNLDLTYAVFALVLAILMMSKPKTFTKLPWAYSAQILGCLSLLNIMILAITSFPTPLRLFPETQSNEWVTFEPYVLLPGFMVSVAIMGHLCLQQRLNEHFQTSRVFRTDPARLS
jgi:hypothetical protein